MKSCLGDEHRIDLTHLATYSLDDAGTREIDERALAGAS